VASKIIKQPSWFWWAPVLFVFIFGAGLSISAYKTSQSLREDHIKGDFNGRSQNYSTVLLKHLQTRAELLQSVENYVETSSSIQTEDLRTLFKQVLLKNREILAIGWQPETSSKELAPISVVEFKDNVKGPFLNILKHSMYKEGLRKAFEHEVLTATPLIKTDNTNRSPGLILIKPVFTRESKKAVGYTVALYDLNKVAAKSMQAVELKSVDLHLTDQTAFTNYPEIITEFQFSSDSKVGQHNHSGLNWETAFFFAGRQWKFISFSTENYLSSFPRWKNIELLLLGFLLTLVGVAYLGFVIYERRKIQIVVYAADKKGEVCDYSYALSG